MTSLGRTLHRLDVDRSRTVIQEIRHGRIAALSAGVIRDRIDAARGFLRGLGVARGDRCVLIAQNSADWIAFTLAVRAEGVILVPLLTQRPVDELAAIIRQSEPAVICGDDPRLLETLASRGDNGGRVVQLEHVLQHSPAPRDPIADVAPDDPVAIIYTSGTSGEPKGAILTGGGVEHVIGCAGARLDSLAIAEQPERVFHYLPFCFAGSWILMLTSLSRDTILSISLDPRSSLIEDLAAAEPHYALNVPLVLERIRARVQAQIASQPPLVRWALSTPPLRPLLHRRIRRRFGSRLRGLICGSAPLARETQEWFQSIGIPVYQVYGLTETTAVCTIDREKPADVVAGRVGHAIDEVELRRDESGEILARGPNIFAGYWRNPQATARVLVDGWLRTGDHGDSDPHGNWRIGGRVDNLIVRPNGHKVAPERIEELLSSRLRSAQQVVLVDAPAGLLAVVSGEVPDGELTAAVAWVNGRVAPHETIRGSRVHRELFTIDNGMMTANGKIKRDRVAAWCRHELNAALTATA
jgi:long-chain acyl-CoA synthetase